MTVNNDGSCSQETRNSLLQKTQVRSCLWPWGSRGKANSHSKFGPALSIEAAREHLEEFVISRAKESKAHEKPNKVVTFSLCDDTYVYDTAFKIFVQWHLLTSITVLGSTHLSVQLHSSCLNCCILLPARAFSSSITHSSVIRSSPSPSFNTAEIMRLFPSTTGTSQPSFPPPQARCWHFTKVISVASHSWIQPCAISHPASKAVLNGNTQRETDGRLHIGILEKETGPQ